MRASFAVRGPGERAEAPRGLLGFLAKSQANHGPEQSCSPRGPSSESEDDGDQERFRYPGMPREPKPIKLTDPYPGGKLAGSKAATEQVQEVEPLIHDGSTTVLFIKAGSEHRALLYLMQKVNRYFALDDMLPEVPPEIAAYHYLMLAPPKDGPVDGDATTSFRKSTLFLLSGMVLRRLKVLAKDPMTLGLLDSTVLQRRLPMRKLGVKLAEPPVQSTAASSSFGGSSSAGSHLARKASFAARLGHDASGGSESESVRRDPKRNASTRRSRRSGPPEFIPVAIYSHPLYLDTAASIIRNFNRTGLIVTPYLYSTIVAAAAVSTIQGWWRSHLIRGMSNFGQMLKMSRAARTIQRAWRAYMLRSRLLMLSSVRRLTAMVGSLLLGANLALTAGHCMALRERAGRPRPAALFPEQRLRFGFDRAGGLMLVEPERMMPKLLRDGNWTPGLPSPPVPRSLPEWCSVPLPLCGERAAAAVHGCREVLGLDSLLPLITRDTVWRDNAGIELSRTTLPDTSLPDPGATAAAIAGGGTADDVVLAIITFPSVHEAAVRAAMLSIYTWDPRRRMGVNLVPLHQTAAARGVQAQAAVVQAINTIAASAGHLIATGPAEAERQPGTPPGAAGGGASPMYTSTASLAWRHAPPRDRYRISGAIGAVTPTLELRSPIRAIGSCSPLPSGGGSPVHTGTGGPSGASSFSLVPSQHSLSRSHSQSHLHMQSHGGSPTRALSPVRQRVGAGSGSVPLSGGPASPKRGQRSPPPSGMLPSSLPSGVGSATRTPSPLRRLRQPPLPPVQSRPGTVPLIPASKFRDLDTTTDGGDATANGKEECGNPAQVAPALPQLTIQPLGAGQTRPRTTPSSKREGEISPVMSLCGNELALGGIAHGQAVRSSGGLYGTQPGAPMPQDNVPLSSLARALSPPPTYRGSASGAPQTNQGIGPDLEGEGAATGHQVPYGTDSTDFALSRNVPPGKRVSSAAAAAAPPAAAGPYSGYDMPDGERQGRRSGPSADDAAGSDGGGAPARATPDSSMWEGEHEAQEADEERAEAETEGRGVGETSTPLDSRASTSISLSSPARMQPPHTPKLKGASGEMTPGEGFTKDQSLEGEPSATPTEAEEEAEALPSEESGPIHTYPHMTVLQRHQAMGLYSNMVILPVPRRPPGAEVETREEDAYRVATVVEGLEGYYDAFSHLQSSDYPPPFGTGGGGVTASGEPTVENPELVVGHIPIDFVVPASVLEGLTEALGNQGRNSRHFADSAVRIGKLINAEEAFARHRQLMSTLMLTQVIGRQTAVGHVQAPNYTPLSVRSMNQIVAEMRRVYQGEAAELVANMREQHKEAIAAVKQELAAAARVVATTSCMQAAVVDSELARAEEDRNRSVKARATRAHMRALRRERATQDRAFAAAFGRQVAGASKHVVRSEIRARDTVMSELAATQGALRRQLDRMTQEHISMAAAEIAAANRMRASIVRSEGWTAQVASHYHLLDQWQADLVALRRDDNYARMRRVGPAGGIWGAARPRELLRAPLPITNVVSAAAAAAAASVAAGGSGSGGAIGTASRSTGGAVIATPAAGAWRSLSASEVRNKNTLTMFTPLDSGGSADTGGLFTALPTGATGVSFTSAWAPFEGDHGSLAASSAPPSALPSRQMAHRRSLPPLPQSLPEGYVPGAGAAAISPTLSSTASAPSPPPLVEDSEASIAPSNASNEEIELEQAAVVVAATMRPSSKAAALAAIAVANGLRQRGSPPRNLVEGPDGRLVDFLPEAYSIQPFGGRQGNNPPRPIGMVVSRY